MGSLVAVRLPPGPAFLEAWDRIWSAGDALLPLPVDAPDALVAGLIERFQPAALVVPPPGQADRTRIVRLEGSRPVPDGTALVVATSGSTGAPKGVVLSTAAVDAAVRLSLDALDVTDGAAWLSCLPWHHVAGLLTVLRSRARGTEPVVHPTFDTAAVARDVAKVSWISLVPTQLRRLLDAEAPLSALDGVLLGGAGPSDELLDRAADDGVRVVVSYGMTETCGGCVHDGRPLPGVRIGLGPDNRVLVHGPVLSDGYRDGRTARVDPPTPMTTLDAAGRIVALAAPDGSWLATEDLGQFDDGQLVVIGRRDDVIISGGENVSAQVIARRLREHPDVIDAAVVAIPDAEWGQAVGAAVVRGRPDLSEDELREHVRGLLGGPSTPRRIVFVEAIPTTTLGKPDRASLRRLLEEAD